MGSPEGAGAPADGAQGERRRSGPGPRGRFGRRRGGKGPREGQPGQQGQAGTAESSGESAAPVDPDAVIPVYSRRAFRIDEHLKRLLKDKAVSEDDERRGQDDVQRLTDRVVAEIDRLVQSKEAEVLAV
jgi:hypothetical protein